MLEGEAGIGKAALWESAVSASRRRLFRVLIARPAQAESKLSFAALCDLLDEVVDDVLPFLPEPQRQALEVALLRRVDGGHRPDQRTVSVAVFGAPSPACWRSTAAGGPR